jgi:hypothetical protein
MFFQALAVGDFNSTLVITHLLRWLGKFHILVIHFPIALLTASALGELWYAWRGVRVPMPAVRFCVALGAASAVAAALLGWLHADFGGFGADDPDALGLHRWVGTVAALWAVPIVLLSERDAHRCWRSNSFRVALWLGALLIGVAGHLGGILVHGNTFLDW